MKALRYLRQRLDERSTYMLIIASIGSVAGLSAPFNWIGFVVLLAASLVPDGTIASGGAP